MNKSIRKSTLQGLGLGNVIDIFKNGKLPVSTEQLITQVFGPIGKRGAMVISGANGIVGAGKVMQFTAKLMKYNIPVIALDLPGTQDGIGQQYKGLVKAFGKNGADDIMKNIIRITYDGKTLPAVLRQFNPKFLLEAIPENLELKKEHYTLFRSEFPDIHIWSVTSGFPSAQLGVGIAHPAFPHEVNKIFEIVDKNNSVHAQLLWSLGLIPMQVSDDWSFVLDVFFCGLMNASCRYHSTTNMPFWKIDKYVRQLVGPNPFRAHDAIGAAGANFLTWSCLHHLEENYGSLFSPDTNLVGHKENKQNWYPPDHFRPLVNWNISNEEKEEMKVLIFGPLFQMTSIMLHEKRSDLATMNALGELCAQFTKGLLATIRNMGEEKVLNIINAYHAQHPEAAKTKWYPEVFKDIASPEWQQLYVNAEHDGIVGVITISRESYNNEVDEELNRAIDFLKKEKINRVILTSDFHFSTQMSGADTNEFFSAIADPAQGERIASSWSATARRLHNDFELSIGFIKGKRCMGGMLELMMHCHYLVAPDDTLLAMPEVTLPVVPGMEGCHWALRKAKPEDRHHLLSMLLEGKPVKAKDSLGWLIDFSGSLEDCLQHTWQVAGEGSKLWPIRNLETKGISNILPESIAAKQKNGTQEAWKAIAGCVEASCKTTLDEAISIQARLAADFMASKAFRKGKIGIEFDKVMGI